MPSNLEPKTLQLPRQTPPQTELLSLSERMAADDTDASTGDKSGTTLEIGAEIEGKYRIEGLLGVGGMGQVYSATHLHLMRPVAIKVLLPSLTTRPEMVERVVREARAASAIGHPNIVAIMDMGWHDGAPFIVMERLDGKNLGEEILANGPIKLPRALSILDQTLDALGAVHERGIIHRDLKPGNIMLVRARDGSELVKVLDFGIAKAMEDDGQTSMTGAGQLIGTPEHMAPEQALADKTIDQRVDVHAAGALLYTMLTGRSPFAAPNPTAALSRLLVGEYAPASEVSRGIPKPVDRVIATALASEREDRFADAGSMRRAAKRLEGIEASTAIGFGPAAPGRGSPPPPSLRSGSGPPPVDAEDRVDDPVAARIASPITRAPDPWSTGQRAAAEADRPLELDHAAVARNESQAPAPNGMPHRPGGPFAHWTWFVLIAVLLGGGYAAWHYRSDLESAAVDATSSSETNSDFVFIMVDTVPKDALVFVDDVQHDESPIEVPKSKDYVKIRVEAAGYEPRVTQLQPTTARRIQVKLDRSRKR